MTADKTGIVLNKTLIPMDPSLLNLVTLNANVRVVFITWYDETLPQVLGISAPSTTLFGLLQFCKQLSKTTNMPSILVPGEQLELISGCPVSIFLVYGRWQWWFVLSLPVPLGFDRANCAVRQHVTGEWQTVPSGVCLVVNNVLMLEGVRIIVGTAKLFPKQNGGRFIEIPDSTFFDAPNGLLPRYNRDWVLSPETCVVNQPSGIGLVRPRYFLLDRGHQA